MTRNFLLSNSNHVDKMESWMSERTLREPIKPKQMSTMKNLEEAPTKTLRTHPECEGIRIQKIALLAPTERSRIGMLSSLPNMESASWRNNGE